MEFSYDKFDKKLLELNFWSQYPRTYSVEIFNQNGELIHVSVRPKK